MGKVTITTAGEYSDYRVLAVLEWLRDDLTPLEARAKYVADFCRDDEDYQYTGLDYHSPLTFVAWLVREGYARDIEAQTLHVGDYGIGQDPRDLKPFEREAVDLPPD